MSLVLPGTACLLILGSVEAIIKLLWAQWSLDCIMWNHSIIMHTGRYRNQIFWNWGLFSSSAEVSWYLDYELHIKGTVPCFWSSLRCLERWIVIYYRGFKFPQREVVLLLLESYAACTSLNCHCARKSPVLVLEWCYKAIGDGEQVFWSYGLPELCITKWYDKPKTDDCLFKMFWLGEKWRSDISVSCNLTKHSDIQSENTRFETLWSSPLAGISINVADSALLPLLFLMSQCILWGCPIINIVYRV
jgi:hypothetical protein